jgi:hypothetical protein
MAAKSCHDSAPQRQRGVETVRDSLPASRHRERRTSDYSCLNDLFTFL